MLPFSKFNSLYDLINKTITIAINTAGFSRVQDIYVLDFVASTICSILSIWIKNSFEGSSKELANLAKVFFKSI